MSAYLGSVSGSIFTIIFFVFLIGTFGYLIGSIKFLGIKLGTAGVLLAALIFGIIASYFPSITIGGNEIALFDEALKANFSLVTKLGTALFVTSIGLIAGPKFFRTFNRKSLSYILTGIFVICIGGVLAVSFAKVDANLSMDMVIGLLTGGLTSTPGLSAAKEVALNTNEVVAGYGIAYLFGVLGVVLFVQIIPKILRVDLDTERENFIAANTIPIKTDIKIRKKIDAYGFFPFLLTIMLGCILGAIEIPGINFSLGTSGGTLIMGLIIGHFGHIGKIDCHMNKDTLNFFRELGLVFFLIGCGVPGGVNFISNVRISYFVYGALMTLVPMIIGFLIARKFFKMNLFNSLGSITGGMTSTPALGALITTAGTDEVVSAYAATYPIALVCVVLLVKILLLFFA